MWTDGINTFRKYYVLGHCTELVQSFSVQDTHLGYQWRSNGFHPLNPGWNAAHSCLAGSAAEEADRACRRSWLGLLHGGPWHDSRSFPRPRCWLMSALRCSTLSALRWSKQTHPKKKFALWRKSWTIYSNLIQDYHKSFLLLRQTLSMSASQIMLTERSSQQ